MVAHQMTKDSGLYHILENLLRLSKAKGVEYIAKEVGVAYRPIVERVHARWKDDKRSLRANALLHQWFGQIATQTGSDAKSIKGECHHEWALDIRLRDEKFAWVWERTGALLSYEKQCSLLASETLGISSRMTTKELSEYMDQIERHYRTQGVQLTEGN